MIIVFMTAVPCFIFIFGRMHQIAVQSSKSFLKMPIKWVAPVELNRGLFRVQIALLTAHVAEDIINIIAFVVFGKDADTATEIGKVSLLLKN